MQSRLTQPILSQSSLAYSSPLGWVGYSQSWNVNPPKPACPPPQQPQGRGGITLRGREPTQSSNVNHTEEEKSLWGAKPKPTKPTDVHHRRAKEWGCSQQNNKGRQAKQPLPLQCEPHSKEMSKVLLTKPRTETHFINWSAEMVGQSRKGKKRIGWPLWPMWKASNKVLWTKI